MRHLEPSLGRPLALPCGFRYAEADPSGPAELCESTPCGTYAIGVCEGCSRRVCGQHSAMTEAGRHCRACRQVAEAAAAEALAIAVREADEKRAAWIAEASATAVRVAQELVARRVAGFPAQVPKYAVGQLRSGIPHYVQVDVGPLWFMPSRSYDWVGQESSKRTGLLTLALARDGQLYAWGVPSRRGLDSDEPKVESTKPGWLSPSKPLFIVPDEPIDLNWIVDRYAPTHGRYVSFPLIREHLIADLQRLAQRAVSEALPRCYGSYGYVDTIPLVTANGPAKIPG